MWIDAINDRKTAWLTLGRFLEQGLKLTRADYERLSDQELVVLTCRGDNRGYETLVRRYQKLVFNVAYQLTHNHEFAADVTQESFIKAYKALPSFRPDAAVKPWLLRIVTNTGLNKLRDEKQDRHESLGPASEDDEGAVDPPDSCNVEVEVELRLSQAMLVDALKKLPVRRRHVFLLFYQQGLSYAEIATVMGETESTIKSLLFRTREQLRNMLKDA